MPYFLKFDGAASNVLFVPWEDLVQGVAPEHDQRFETVDEARAELIEHLQSIRDQYNDAIREARRITATQLQSAYQQRKERMQMLTEKGGTES